jgi:hypothetical protein
VESNVEKGRRFRDQARIVLERALGVAVNYEVAVAVGQPPKSHKFDLVSSDQQWFVECDNVAWRENGGVPQAKITSLGEAAATLRMLPSGSRKVLCLKRAAHPARKESLAEYYARLHRHLLADVALAEIDPNSQCIRWLVGRLT